MESIIDVSRSAQIRDIEASFAASSDDKFDLSTLRHPNKPNITAVESFEIFPDAEIWANAYDLFRFSERPGERPVEVRVLVICFRPKANKKHRWMTLDWIAQS